MKKINLKDNFDALDFLFFKYKHGEHYKTLENISLENIEPLLNILIYKCQDDQDIRDCIDAITGINIYTKVLAIEILIESEFDVQIIHNYIGNRYSKGFRRCPKEMLIYKIKGCCEKESFIQKLTEYATLTSHFNQNYTSTYIAWKEHKALIKSKTNFFYADRIFFDFQKEVVGLKLEKVINKESSYSYSSVFELYETILTEVSFIEKLYPERYRGGSYNPDWDVFERVTSYVWINSKGYLRKYDYRGSISIQDFRIKVSAFDRKLKINQLLNSI